MLVNPCVKTLLHSTSSGEPHRAPLRFPLVGIKRPSLNRDQPDLIAYDVMLKLQEDRHLESRDKIFKREKKVSIRTECGDREGIKGDGEFVPHMEGI